MLAARDLLAVLDDEGRSAIGHAVDALEWQTWANPEFMQFDTGLRLDLQPEAVRDASTALVRASLSAEGYDLVRAMMRINGFLGEVVDLPTVLNEFSYNVVLYGEPDLRTPWGWQLFGHHCAVNCLVVDGRMVLSPVFLGAEPDEIDDGPHAGLRHVLAERIELGTALMAALPPAQRSAATVYAQMVDPAMPPGRVHPGDERHLGRRVPGQPGHPRRGRRGWPRCPRRRRRSPCAIAERSSRLLPDGPARRPAAGGARPPGRDLVLAGSAATSPETSSTTGCSRPSSSPSSTTTAASSSTTTPPSRSTCTPCCARRTATTTAVRGCGSGSERHDDL